jgi:hypothetical protein
MSLSNHFKHYEFEIRLRNHDCRRERRSFGNRFNEAEIELTYRRLERG